MKDPRQKRKQLWNVIIPQVCTEVINEMIILAIALGQPVREDLGGMLQVMG